MGQRGLSLIEIMIVVAMIGGMMVLGTTMLFPGNDQKVQEQAVKLAGTIKFLYDEAAVKNKYYRIVFNLDDRTYMIESSSDPVMVALEDEEKIKKPSASGETLPSADGSPPPEAGFSPEEGLLIKPVKLPAGVRFKDILVMHEKTPRQSGTVQAYFFPNGYVEPMVINFADDDEEVFYSLEINPLTGRAKIRSEYFELKEGTLRPEVDI